MYHIDEVVLPCSGSMYTLYRDKERVTSYGGTNTPFNLGYGTEKGCWEWVQATNGGVQVPVFMKAMEFYLRDGEYCC